MGEIDARARTASPSPPEPGGHTMERLSTGVPGLDEILDGGLPQGSLVMVGGPPGAGKTVLVEQLLFHHARQGAHALFLTTLSEPHDKLLRHAEGFRWFDPAL